MDLEAVRDALLAQAWLFDDPHAYVAGFEDALDAVWPLLQPHAAIADDRDDPSRHRDAPMSRLATASK